MRRIVALAAVTTLLMSLSVVVAAKPKKRGDLKLEFLKTHCKVVGGTYTEFRDKDGVLTGAACILPDGTVIYCSFQDCFEFRPTGPEQGGRALLLGAILAGQQSILADQQRILTELGQIRSQIATGLDNLQSKLDDVKAACAPPDLVPVPIPGSNPPDFCQSDGRGNLVVRVKNQGLTDAAASTLRVTFSTPSGPVPVDVSTPALAGGGGLIDLAIPIPESCFLPATPFPSPCQFQIAVDVADVVVESPETNNTASGVCTPIL